MPNMKRLAITIAVAVLFCPLCYASGQAKQTIKIVVLGEVWHPGPQEVPIGTPLEDVLNAAVCHRDSNLKKISVRRKAGDRDETLTVGPWDDKKNEAPIQFRLKDGDIVVVFDRLFNESNHKLRQVVTGPFVLRATAPAKRITAQQGVDGKPPQAPQPPR